MLVVPHGVNTDIFNPSIPPFSLNTKKKVKFLFNAIPHARKLHDRVFKAYNSAFSGDDDVCLVLKTKFLVPSDPLRKPFEVNVEEMLQKEFGKRRNPPEVEVINDIFIDDIGSLYTACDCVVSMSSCEGFWLPGIEAMACGSLVIAPRHGGQLEFLNDDNALLVDTKEMLAPLTHQYWRPNPKAVVGDPDVRHCAELMRKVYDNLDAEKARMRDSAKSTVEKLSWENAAKMVLDLPMPQVSRRMATKRRVLYIIPYDMVGGGEVWVRETIKRLDRRLFEPHVAFLNGMNVGLRQLLEGLDVTVEDLKEQGRGHALKTLVESGNYSIIHFYNSFGVYQVLQMAWKDGLRCRVVETVHSDLVWNDSMTKVSTRSEMVCAIAAISNDMAKRMLKLGNKNVTVLPQHIDWDRFLAVQRSKEALDEFGIPKNYVVGFVGRLSPEKNIPIILKCAQMLPEVSFVIVGDGPQRQPLTQMAANLKNVFFTGARNDVERFYGAFDALVLPSDVEGLPLVILEAMSAGTPVIASDVGAVSEAVMDGMTGLVVWNARDPSLFARAIVRMRNEPGLGARCSENSKAMAITMKKKSEDTNINGFYGMLFQRSC
jgi:glycosyltransferase involved in cell wall biosynthesis